jgi:hypothetical protein
VSHFLPGTSTGSWFLYLHLLHSWDYRHVLLWPGLFVEMGESHKLFTWDGLKLQSSHVYILSSVDCWHEPSYLAFTNILNAWPFYKLYCLC